MHAKSCVSIACGQVSEVNRGCLPATLVAGTNIRMQKIIMYNVSIEAYVAGNNHATACCNVLLSDHKLRCEACNIQKKSISDKIVRKEWLFPSQVIRISSGIAKIAPLHILRS